MNVPTALRWDDPWLWVAAALVLGHTKRRFNTPSTSRSATTFRRFHVAAVLYSLAAIASWSVVTALPKDVVSILVGGLPELLDGVAWPLVTALIFTALMPRAPGIHALDARVRSVFHDFARITAEAEALAGRLRSAPLSVGEKLRDEVRSAFHLAQLREEDAVFETAGGAPALWTRLTALKLIIAGWARGPFGQFHRTHRGLIQEAEAEYASLEGTVRRQLALLRSLRSERRDLTVAKLMAEIAAGVGHPSSPGTAGTPAEVELRIKRRVQLAAELHDEDPERQLGEIAAGIESRFRARAAKLEGSLLDVIARAVLHRGRTPRTRRRLLWELGFRDAWSGRNPFPDRLTGLFVGLLLYYPSALVVTGLVQGIAPTQKRVLTGLVVALVYMAAILVAIYPKASPLFQRDGAERPIRGYLASALLAMGVWAVAFLTLWIAVEGSTVVAVERFAQKWPWMLLAGVTALVTAWSVDNQPRRGLRWMELAGQAVIAATTAAVVVFLLRVTGGMPAATPWLTPHPMMIIGNAFVTGAVIGAYVPHWHRTFTRRRGPMPQAGEPASPEQATALEVAGEDAVVGPPGGAPVTREPQR